MKDLLRRIWESWLKKIPWWIVAAAVVAMALILAFLVKGDLVWTDWIVGEIFAIVIAVAVWIVAKKSP